MFFSGLCISSRFIFIGIVFRCNFNLKFSMASLYYIIAHMFCRDFYCYTVKNIIHNFNTWVFSLFIMRHFAFCQVVAVLQTYLLSRSYSLVGDVTSAFGINEITNSVRIWLLPMLSQCQSNSENCSILSICVSVRVYGEKWTILYNTVMTCLRTLYIFFGKRSCNRFQVVPTI